jgi:hypothetical protein
MTLADAVKEIQQLAEISEAPDLDSGKYRINA